MNPIRILLIDDHELFLSGVSALLEREPGLRVIGRASRRKDALAAASLKPDVILLDLDLRDECSLDFLPELLEASGAARILIVTALPDAVLHLRAVALGAMGVFQKADSAELLLKAIYKIYAGEAWLNKSMVSNLVTEFHGRSNKKIDRDTEKIASLTTRELEVIRLASEGRRNKQIGEGLFIAEKTVRHYLTSIYHKLEVKDRTALLIYAYQHNLAKVPCLKPQSAKSGVSMPNQTRLPS